MKNKLDLWKTYSRFFSKQIIFIALVTLVISGCASIMSGSKQNVKITSDPSVADVKIEQLLMVTNAIEWEGKTPANIKLWRKGSFLVTISLPGYQKTEIPISGGRHERLGVGKHFSWRDYRHSD